MTNDLANVKNGGEILAHSRIGASSMHRWAECPGSIRLSAGIESKSSKYAEEGTEAHEVAAKILLNSERVADVSDEMLEAAMVYVGAVLTDKPSHSKLLVEHRFDLSSIHPGLFGTCDAIILDYENKILRVYDYKHGAGLPVEVEQNPQLMYYGLGALLSTPEFRPVAVELNIVQPRCPHPKGPIRRWRFASVEMLDFADDLKKFALATEDPFAPLKAGDHCRFCPASGICPELKNKAVTLAKKEFSAVETYSPKELSEVLDWLPVLKAWIESVHQFAYAESMAGRTPPGWKLVAKRATRKWRDDNAAAHFLEENFPRMTRDFFERSLKSAPQVEKLLGKKEFEKVLPHVVAISSGETLVPSSDNRPEVKKVTAAEEFGSLDLLT